MGTLSNRETFGMFLCCGDALFDLFAADGETVGEIRLGGHVGGSPLNVAVGLARMGNPSGYLCKNSTDTFGQRIRRYLDDNGVSGNLIVPSDRNSTLAIVETDESGSASYAFYTDGTADRSMEEGELPTPLPEAVELVHVGSYSTVTDPTGGALLTLVRRERTARVISYDPNVRLAIEPDPDVWRERFAGFAACADVVKASDEDIAALRGASCSLESFAADTLALGPRLVAVTRGGEGALVFANDGRSAEAAGVDVTVQDTVGAGDTFQASTLHRLRADGALDGGRLDVAALDLQRLAEFAASGAALTCTRSGADLPTLAEIEAFMAERGGR